MLKRESILLDDVVVYKDKEKLRPYIKKLRKAYKKYMADYSHWLEVNLKSLTLIKKMPKEYFEADGYLFYIASKIGREQAFAYRPFLIPNQTRMTKPAFKIPKEYRRDLGVLWYSWNSSDLSAFKLFKYYHPLRGGNYQKYIFKRIDEEQINGKLCEVLEYRLGVTLRYLKFLNGRIWIDKSTKKIVKEVTSFNDKLKYWRTIFINIDYANKGDKIFIKNFNQDMYNNKKNYHKRTIVEVRNVDTTLRKWYNRDYFNGYDIALLLDSTKTYNNKYWSRYPLIKNPFRTELKELANDKTIEQMFIEGAKVELLNRKHPKYKSFFKGYRQEKNKLLEEHLKNDLNLK